MHTLLPSPAKPFRCRGLRAHRRAAVATLFAIMAVPVIALVGLAIDFGIWNESYATLEFAASAAALNAAKTAVNAEMRADSNYLAEGKTAGQQWFLADIGQGAYAAGAQATTPTVTVTSANQAVTAAVSFTSTVTSIFGNIFGIAHYPMNVAATVSIPLTAFLNVDILLDNSGSMEIAATPGDITAMLYQTPCSLPGAWYNVGPWSTSDGTSIAKLGYGYAYECAAAATYDGQIYGEPACPLLALGIFPAYPLASSYKVNTGPLCTKLAKQSGYYNQYPVAGAPCAFACHNASSAATVSASVDLYGVARSSLGKGYGLCSASGSTPGSCAITLRIDLVKTAVDSIISSMQSYNVAALNNLNVGIFDFDTTVHQVYPSSSCGSAGSMACQAGGNWITATADVGAPPTQANTADTGIIPFNGPDASGTNMPAAMTAMASTYLTAAGDGTSASSPFKALFLITDGMVNYINSGGTQIISALDPSLCAKFKAMGFSVYVLYLPYYSLTNGFYLGTNAYNVAEGTGSTSSAYNLQQCASDPVNNYIAIDPSSPNSVSAALQTFLQRALVAPAKFTQ